MEYLGSLYSLDLERTDKMTEQANKTGVEGLSAFEKSIVKVAYDLKQMLSTKNLADEFSISFSLSGRVDGELKYSFRMDNCKSWSEKSIDVKGNSMKQVIAEFERRAGYVEQAETLLLPNVPDTALSDDAPF